MSTTQKNKKVDLWVFLPPIIFFMAFIAWIFNDAKKAGEGLAVAYKFVTHGMGGIFEIFVVIMFFLCVYFAFGPYAKRRLGEEKPEFSKGSWLGMIFTSFAGLGVLTWTSIEFFYYIQTPPFGIEPFSTESYPWALAYPFFHWGFTAWSMNTIFGLVFGYLFFVKKLKLVRPSTACETLLGKRVVQGWGGKLIDAFFVIGFVGGVVTAIGVNVPIIVELISKIFGVGRSFALDAVVIMSWSLFMAVLLYFGLNKGIRLLSDFRVYFGFGILAFLFIFGPTTYIINTFTDTMGHLFQNVVRMSLYTDPHGKSGVPQAWTVFYWTWYLALVLQAGIFLGRISKGRTVREYVMGSLTAATAGSWVFFAVFTNFSMFVHQEGKINIADVMANSGHGKAIVEIWTQMPLASIMMVVLLVYGYISMQTLLTGATYTLAMVSTKQLSGEEEPPTWIRIFWSLTVGALAIGVGYIGGLQPAQTTTIVGSVPMLIIAVLILLSFAKDIRKVWGVSRESVRDTEKEPGIPVAANQVTVKA